jgi:lysozyme
VNWPRLVAQLKRHEGCKRAPNGTLIPYQDTVGIWTGGYGYNFAAHGVEPFAMTEQTAHNLLEADIHDAVRIAKALFQNFDNLNDARQEVVVNMAYNLGLRLGQFQMLQTAVHCAEWDAAADSMLKSLWARQVQGRAIELAKQMRTGISTQEIPDATV